MFFLAAADKSEDYQVDDIIKFHQTITNVNPGFPGWNPSTNIFTCPYTGYYFFTVTLFRPEAAANGSNYYAKLRMSHDGSYRNIVTLSNHKASDGSINHSGTVSTIVQCEQGQNVWVAMDSDSIRLYDDYGHYNQFSGILIQHD